MATALDYFAGCVNLCDGHDLTRIAVPNRVMMGHCRIYTCEFDSGLDDMRTACQAAVRIGNRHAEMFATQSMGLCLTAAGRYAEAEEFQIKALEQARALNARRYEAVILAHCAEVTLSKGRKADALALARAGRDISEEAGPGFAGPILFGLLSLLEDKRGDQEAALAAGEALLAQGSVGHNHFWFRRYAIERAIMLKDWNEVHRQADSLLRRMAAEPLAYASLIADRARGIAQRGLGYTDEAEEAQHRIRDVTAISESVKIGALGIALQKVQ
jgi:ATP/maltotriose-dependent transcriptional regulator MalT